ncbi:hypothetical protein LCGC14_0364440 [marine sediment metagenome]|uniref:Uncharacterized protein n=1 Tax=marine sediment metagenome TaxID=412755 RepID=A0A0F9TPR7_9ZZZZ
MIELKQALKEENIRYGKELINLNENEYLDRHYITYEGDYGISTVNTERGKNIGLKLASLKLQHTLNKIEIRLKYN